MKKKNNISITGISFSILVVLVIVTITYPEANKKHNNLEHISLQKTSGIIN